LIGLGWIPILPSTISDDRQCLRVGRGGVSRDWKRRRESNGKETPIRLLIQDFGAKR
jgi:hypothetical protein